jgi:hypothetical protein
MEVPMIESVIALAIVATLLGVAGLARHRVRRNRHVQTVRKRFQLAALYVMNWRFKPGKKQCEVNVNDLLRNVHAIYPSLQKVDYGEACAYLSHLQRDNPAIGFRIDEQPPEGNEGSLDEGVEVNCTLAHPVMLTISTD